MPVYFIRAGEQGPVKIGTADDVFGRLIDLQCGNHERLSVLRVVDGGRGVERALHRHYDERRMRGEWFRFCETMLTIEPPVIIDIRRPSRPANPLLEQAIDAAGGTAELARRVGVTSQAVSQWDKVPAERVLEVERATGGAVTRHELRPDIFGPALAEHAKGAA